MGTRERRMVGWALVFVASLSCSRNAKRQPVASPKAVPVAPVVDAVRWVIFDGPPVQSGESEPKWTLSAPGLPAVSGDGTLVTLPVVESSLGDVPNLSLKTIRLADESVVAIKKILTYTEFVAASESPGKQGYAELGRTVNARVREANDALSKSSWRTLVECSVEPAVSNCPLDSRQELRCEGRRLMREDETLTLIEGGQWTRVPTKASWWTPKSFVEDGLVKGIRRCLGGAWLDTAGTLMLVKMLSECEAGGDSCTQQPAWHALTLAPKPPAPATTSSTLASEAACPAGMIEIPAGSFTMGSNDGIYNEKPPHLATVKRFCLDKTEVSVDAYAACVKAKICTLPQAPNGFCNWGDASLGNHPVNCVRQTQSSDFCVWAKKRLPTETEWEFAARGEKSSLYPWGDSPPSKNICWSQDGGTCALDAHPADVSARGVLGLGGNVAEWTASRATESYAEPTLLQNVIFRGGSWRTTAATLMRSARRGELSAALMADSIGFRCAL